jgi:hypothetical protein
MSIATPFKTLGAGNGFPYCLEKIELSSIQEIGSSDVSLEDAMKTTWLLSEAVFKLAKVNFANGSATNVVEGVVKNQTIGRSEPKDRASGEFAQAYAYEEIYSEGSIDLGGYNVTVGPVKYALDGEGKKRYFHGITFTYSANAFDSYYGGDSSYCTYSSGPMLNTAGISSTINKGAEVNAAGFGENGDEGYATRVRQGTQSIVTINGIKFVKTEGIDNDKTSEGGSPSDAISEDYSYATLPGPVVSPLLDFWTFS